MTPHAILEQADYPPVRSTVAASGFFLCRCRRRLLHIGYAGDDRPRTVQVHSIPGAIDRCDPVLPRRAILSNLADDDRGQALFGPLNLLNLTGFQRGVFLINWFTGLFDILVFRLTDFHLSVRFVP